jgi:hypothetical protein
MGRRPNVAKTPYGGAPQVQAMKYATGQVFKSYAMVVDDANGEVVECGADPQSILGVALQGAGTGPGFGFPNAAETTVVTGRNQEVSVALADRVSHFSARGVNGGTDPVLPLQTHIGEQYSLAKVGDDWVIDIANPTTPAVEIVDIVPAPDNFFIFKFLESVLSKP